LARCIWRSEGPSGRNRDYLFHLEAALKELGVVNRDVHVQDLADRVRTLEEEERGNSQNRIEAMVELHQQELANAG